MKLTDIKNSLNEISAIGGLKQVVKGNTKEVEGIKLSKEMAQAMIDWFNSSPYGRKYPKAAKARLHLSLGIMMSFGLDRYAKFKGAKEELKHIKDLSKAMRDNVNEESVNEVNYDDSLADFNKELEKTSEVKKAAKHYNKSTKEVVKALQTRIKVNRYSDKSIKQISINYTEDGPLSSKVTIKLSKNYKQNESVNEGKYDGMLDVIEDLVSKASSFMDVGNQLKKHKVKYSFSTSMMPIYRLDKLPIAIVNKRYVDKADREVGDIAIGLIESIEESLNEVNPRLNKKVKSYLDSYLKGEKKNSPEHQHAIMLIMKGALTDANFHSEAKQLDKFFPKAKQSKHVGTSMEGVIEDKGVDIAGWAKWDGHDIIDAFAFYTNMNIGGGFGNKLTTLKESVNEGRAFVQAAKKAKEEGKTEFEFNGKTYPITLKERTISERRLGKVDLLKSVEDGETSRVEGVKISKDLAFELRMFLQRPLLARTRTGIAIDNSQMKDAILMLAKVGVHKRLSSGVKKEFADLLKKYK